MKRSLSKLSICVLGTAAILFFFHPSAMLAAEIPGKDTAGAEQERFEKNGRAEERAKEFKPRPEEELIIEVQKPPAEAAPSVTFLLKEIQIFGNEHISTDELQKVAANYINQSVGFGELKEIVSRLKQYYRMKGYLAAYVYIPPQDVTQGFVKFVVIEGKIGNIEVKGNRWFSTRVIKRMLRLRAGQTVFYRDLQATLKLFNKNKDIKAKAILKPGAERETTDLEINVKDKFPIHLETEVNNLGTENTGVTRWGISLTHNNLLGQMDQATGRFQIGKGAWAVGSGYLMPIGSHGTSAGFSYSHSEVDLGGQFKALGVKGGATTYGIDILQSAINRPSFSADLNLGMDWKSVKNHIQSRLAGHDELRILNTGVNFETTDRWGKIYNSHSFHFGFDNFLGASDKVDVNATRTDTGGQFFIYRSSLARLERLPAGMALVSRGAVQLTPDRVSPSEQFHLGGAFSVRGYPEGDYLADNGAYLSNEIYVPTYFFPKNWKLPFSAEPLRNQIYGVGFFDFGGGSIEKSLAGEEKDQLLAGLGGGLRIHLFDRVYARFQWAARTGSKTSTGANNAFYYGISTELF